MEAKLKPTDEVLQRLVAERRLEVERLQKAQADQLKDMNTRGQARLAALKKSLPKDISAVLQSLDKTHDEASAATKALVERVKAKFAATTPSAEHETAMHPGLAGGRLVAPGSLGWFTPYYGMCHGADGKIHWQGYNPGNIKLGDWASGAGPGIFTFEEASFTVYMDWWFSYVPNETRYYGHTIWVPFHGFYILYADDGFWDSKQAQARVALSAAGYQYNYKAPSSTNVFEMNSQNINVNDRIDGWRTMNYADLLATDPAYLLVVASFYVYARGGGSTAQLNFSDGNANYIGLPWLYVS